LINKQLPFSILDCFQWHLPVFLKLYKNTNKSDEKQVLPKKAGKRLISHRSTAYPCFLPDLGEFSGSWSYETCPDCKIRKINFKHKFIMNDL